ncbi:MAG: MFS transporter [Chloroflexi bacterium]|nr:MFS transporter [Chloroflexota bacterium]
MVVGKWPTLLLLSAATLLIMSVWFSASAVVPQLTQVWKLNDSGRAWLTMSVQIGFVVGAFGSALLGLADRLPSRWMMSISAGLAALATALIPTLAQGLGLALLLRFLTGLVLAGVYPVGMKIMATWTRSDRGLGIGLLVGALTLGSGAPHLLNAAGGLGHWTFTLYLSAALAAVGAIVSALFIREGPFAAPAPRFNWRHVGVILRKREIVLANIGYLGHMWELFAMWAWLPIFLVASFASIGLDARLAGLVSFAVFAAGALGSLLAGQLADRMGRTVIISLLLGISGACSLLVGFLFGGPPFPLIALSLVWGFAVVADSAQFSASVSELTDQRYVGTSLTLQTSMGFLLTLFTIRLIPSLVSWIGWEWAFAFLAIGPAVGIWGMLALRRLPAAERLAVGRG